MALQLDADDALSIYYNAFKGESLFNDPVRERFIRMPKATLWNQVRLPAAIASDHCDVYFGGALVVPTLTRIPRVVVVHDCMSFRLPQSKSRRWAAYLRFWTRESARRSSIIICSSEWAARECTTFLGVEREKIRVVPAAVDRAFGPAEVTDRERIARHLAARFDLHPPYVLQVGGYELHKGGDTAVEAVDLLRRRGRDVTLVRCGIRGPSAGGKHSTDLGYIDDPDLYALYQSAAVVCVPSTHEGFGLPLLEAMASGAPVVAARASSLPEVGGDVALYAEPGDPRSFAEAIDRLLVDTADADRRRQAGVRRAADFTWERTASTVLELLREAAAAS
jgi:glycosyltransferase involved in cell wall biosynthesis